ncbi:MAG: tRNA uridine(34) 5-carboxymethylaminomethyl modification radical SAM/GNAT enzyme Elp3, partial [Candidatus Beckwithbacteria bacterium]
MNKYNFNPNKYKKKLLGLINALKQDKHLTQKTYHKLIKKFPKSKSQVFAKSEIIAGIRLFAKKDQKKLIQKIVMKPVRTLSGVVPVTLLTKPYPCPGKCIYCPDDIKMPKSYLSSEPGAQRAGHHHFDPYHQVASRLNAYYANGHPTDKVELIVLGGTWSVYPLKYKIWFIKRCFDALNSFQVDRVRPCQSTGQSTWVQLKKSQTKNETAKTRCIGLSLETRPDFITEQELIDFRKFGCTKVQIGVQSLSDKILTLNQRGHGVKQTKKAFKLLRLAGFKIQAHWMANLYGSSVKKDISDFKKLFSNKNFRPDELKLYPTALLKTAKLMDLYNQKLWKPYTNQELIKVLSVILSAVPCYCRVTRIIRDFSSQDIIAGSKTSNLRQLVETKAKNIHEIRYREIRKQPVKIKDLKLKITTYQTSIGTEKFLEFITPDNKIVAFLRLSLPKIKPFIK